MDANTRNILFGIGKVATVVGGNALNAVLPGIGTGIAIAGSAGLSAWQKDLEQQDTISQETSNIVDARSKLRKNSLFNNMTMYDMINSNKSNLSYKNISKYKLGDTLLSGVYSGIGTAATMGVGSIAKSAGSVGGVVGQNTLDTSISGSSIMPNVSRLLLT